MYMCLCVSVPPSAPRSLRASLSPLHNSVKLSWKSPESNGGSPLKGYTVEQFKPDTEEYAPVAELGPKVKEHILTDLPPATPHQFRVRAHNVAGVSDCGAQLEEPIILPPKDKIKVLNKGKTARVDQWMIMEVHVL